MPKPNFIALLVAGPLVGTLVAQAPPEYSREVRYEGRKLDGQVFLCRSDRAVGVGYRVDAVSGNLVEVTDVARQRNVTTWRIALRGSQADVVTFTGATQTLEAPTVFSVRRTQASMLLSRQGEPALVAGASSETITIDMANSTFVYSGQDVNLLMNKTNVFVGSCVPSL